MLKKELKAIVTESSKWGWVLEPDAKRLLSICGIDVPGFSWARSADEAIRFAEKIGFPVVGKLVSPEALHKSDVDGVVVGIDSAKSLEKTFHRFSSFKDFAGMLVEEMVCGIELIVGAKVDYQFGPVILLGMGGTAVEIYQDTTLRMAPLKEMDVESMLKGLQAHKLLKGYRGSQPVSLEKLSQTLMAFSSLVMNLEGHFESIDLNPVMCSAKRCVVADARIMLQR
ncbi:MAG: acetate--CoA ligase family protein [Thermodesulfobacteriota bacterium]|nr:acetate--CoA ligase family protein [Thermodesulfobacteriota bacterium]